MNAPPHTHPAQSGPLHATAADDHMMMAAKHLYASGFRLLLAQQYMAAHEAFLEVFTMLRESLVKLAECKLASNQFGACTHVCTSLLSRRHCAAPLRTRVLLVRALALAGLHHFTEALADLHHAGQLLPPNKQYALHCLTQRMMQRKHEAENSACSSSTQQTTTSDEVTSRRTA